MPDRNGADGRCWIGTVARNGGGGDGGGSQDGGDGGDDGDGTDPPADLASSAAISAGGGELPATDFTSSFTAALAP